MNIGYFFLDAPRVLDLTEGDSAGSEWWEDIQYGVRIDDQNKRAYFKCFRNGWYWFAL